LGDLDFGGYKIVNVLIFEHDLNDRKDEQKRAGPEECDNASQRNRDHHTSPLRPDERDESS
jgi:hypothetical protein